VSPNASFKEIQKAYRDLVQKYHPDKDAAKTKEYTEITQKLNEVYDYFRKQQRASA
jgi:curved DNA-binding protein CbpA